MSQERGSFSARTDVDDIFRQLESRKIEEWCGGRIDQGVLRVSVARSGSLNYDGPVALAEGTNNQSSRRTGHLKPFADRHNAIRRFPRRVAASDPGSHQTRNSAFGIHRRSRRGCRATLRLWRMIEACLPCGWKTLSETWSRSGVAAPGGLPERCGRAPF